MKTTIERNTNHKEGGRLVRPSQRDKMPRDGTSLLLMRFLSCFIMLLPCTALASANDPAPGQQRDLLSSHDTVARFTGLKDHQCMGLTALCPDRCGESGKLATFTIVNYLHYAKPGEYGDPKQEQFLVLVEDNMKNLKVPKTIRDAILVLKPGDLVHLQWNHDYVTQDGSKFPERPIRKLTVLTKEQADKLTAEANGKAK